MEFFETREIHSPYYTMQSDLYRKKKQGNVANKKNFKQ